VLPQGFKNSPTIFGNQLARDLEKGNQREKLTQEAILEEAQKEWENKDCFPALVYSQLNRHQ